jgi:hypothetical protein
MITTHENDISDNLGEPADDTTPQRRPRRWVAAVVVLALGIGGFAVFQHNRSAGPVTIPGTAVTAAELESKYGTRIDMVALTALGGLVQLRFTVLDKTKAETLFHVAENMPALIAEPSGKILHAPTGMRHHFTLLDGGSYFVLYANAGNALSPGTPVSVLIDTVKLEHLATAS